MITPADPKYKMPTGEESTLDNRFSVPLTTQAEAPVPDSKTRTSWAYVVKRAHNGAIIAGLGLATAAIVTTFVVTQQRFGKANKVQSDYKTATTDLKTIPGTSIGREGETLTVGGATILKGKVTAAGDLDVVGKLNTGAPLDVSALQVTGASTLSAADVKSNLSVAGTSNLQGNVTVANLLTVTGNINVTGNSSVGGTLTAGNLSAKNATVGGILTLGGHVVSGGLTPGVSAGGAVGGAGTVSISGNDRAGTVTINTGQSPPAGVLANITFRSAYSTTPRVVVSPIGASTGALQYYLNRSSGGFTIATLNGAPQGTSFAFDYVVEQ